MQCKSVSAVKVFSAVKARDSASCRRTRSCEAPSIRFSYPPVRARDYFSPSGEDPFVSDFDIIQE